ncbi:MAG: polyphosphate kinase 1 [Coriobacteriia bacterium]|nr:polyphosphate kinase 1 [Coriobacteriia bacterium]
MNDETVGAGGLPSSVLSGDEAQPAAPSPAEAATRVRPEPTTPPQAGVVTVPEIEPMPLVAEPEPALPPAVDLTAPALYLNREMSLLDFQERVLEEAEDSANPLLERVKFLSIFSSNMAEFYMVRVAGLKQQVAAGVRDLSADGLTPAEQLQLVRDRASSLLRRSRRAFKALRDELCAAGIYILDYDELDDAQKRFADEYFESYVYPVLTPLAFDPARPFPHISNLSLNLAILIRTPEGEERFARVKMPRALPRLVPVCAPEASGPHCELKPDQPSRGRAFHFVWLEQLIISHMDMIFPGSEVVEAHAFRVTRDAEVAIQELEAEDLLETIEEGVRKRRFGSVVRVTVTPSLPDFVRDILVENLKLDPEDIVVLEPPIGASNLMELYKIDRPDLKDTPFRPAPLQLLDDEEQVDLFAAIRERDILLHRPFDSFEPFVDLLKQAASDPDVLAIKMTLYRVGKDSPVVEALLEAAQNGKEVAALVELKARFDEESNIGWARRLEQEGVHVVYGVLGLKTHSKIALIVRREGKRIRRYLHLGTGNYNVVTATQYTDLDFLTADEAMGEDATELFNFLTGYALRESYESFLVAPNTIRSGLEGLVMREIEHARAGRGGHMILKANSLVDAKVTKLLYEASIAGVKIELLIRGICQVRPGVLGVSENIRVRSVVGRFLEHSRVYYFGNAGDPTVLVGSADLMRRNLDRRVEILFPIKDPSLIKRLKADALDIYFADNTHARDMQPDGTYVRAQVAEGEERVDAQQTLIERSMRHAPSS